MADIWLMRHGAYEGHRPGYHAPPDAALTAEGRMQIRHSLPLPSGVTGIITSPILRARQTAEIVTYLTCLPIIATTPLLSEWRAPSIALGQTSDTYPQAYRVWREHRLAHTSLACQDGESLAALHDRARRCSDFLRSTADGHDGGIVAVSHKLLLGVLTHLQEGPEAFTSAVDSDWSFAERRLVQKLD